MSVASVTALERAPMFRVSLILEALRARPALMFWVATLAQGALWTLVPSLFYAAPPGELPLVLAVGNEWLLGSPYGPPLAFWAANIAFNFAGIVGVYLLSQLCVVVTFWAVFTLGRRILGAAHAAMAILLMAGISVFTVPTIEFSQSVLAMPLTALTLLFGYRALADNRRGDWFATGIMLGSLLLTTYAGLLLLALFVIFVVATVQGRRSLRSLGPWAAAIVLVVVASPHLWWLWRAGLNPLPGFEALPGLLGGEKRLLAWGNLLLLLLFSHAGLVVLAMVAGGVLAGKNTPVPAVERVPAERFAKIFVYFFALAPALIATLLAVLMNRRAPVGGAAPLVVLSGLAVIVAAGDTIRLYRQRISAFVWLGLLVVPPAVIVAATVTLPWTAAVDLEVSKPASAMGQFFTDTFRRRTGRPLAIVVGDVRTAGLVALASADRPSLYIDGSPALSPWLSDNAVREKGAILVWPATDGSGPPPALKERFPDMVPEVPRSFDRSVQGRLPLLRIGWAMIRPRRSTQ
jgi:4-amino-4-deoxy-L-arabinose transferase-like glycosyltransferase